MNLSSIHCFPDIPIYLGRIWKGNIILKILFSTGINIDYFIFKRERHIQISLWQFCISYINFAIWVSTISLPCAIIYSENYWQTLWISRKICRNKYFYTFILFLIKTSLSHWSTIELADQAFLILVIFLASFIHSLIHLFFFIICLFFMVICQSLQGRRIHDTWLAWSGLCLLSAAS